MEIGSKTVKIILKRGGERFREEGKTAVKTREEGYKWIKNGEVGYLTACSREFPLSQLPNTTTVFVSAFIKYRILLLAYQSNIFNALCNISEA